MINKLCPFCGSEPEKSNNTDWVFCKNKECPISIYNAYDCSYDAQGWNTRPIEDKLNARIAELEAEVKELKNEWHQPEELPIEDGWYLVEWDDYGKLEWVPMFWFVGWYEADYTHYYGKIKRWRKLPKS